MTDWNVWSRKARSGWPRRKDRHPYQGLSESIQPSRGGRFGGWTATVGRIRRRDVECCGVMAIQRGETPWAELTGIEGRGIEPPGASCGVKKSRAATLGDRVCFGGSAGGRPKREDAPAWAALAAKLTASVTHHSA